MVVGACLVVSLAGLVSWLLLQRWNRQKFWEKQGITGPRPSLMFGNLNELRKRTNYEVIQGWTKQYGKTYGYYHGDVPVLVTSDVKLIKEAFVQKHQHFHGRQPLPLPSPSDDNVLAFTSGRTWKRQRAVVSQFFSSLMLKQVTPQIETTVEHFIGLLNEKCRLKKATEMLSIFQAFSLEAIARCAFSMDTESQRNQNDAFLVMVRNFFKIGNFARRSFVLMLAASFPSCRWLWNIPITLFKCLRLFTDPQDILMSSLLPVINKRRAHKTARKDLLDILIASEVKEPTEIHNSVQDKFMLNNFGKGKIERKLNRQEVEAQTMLMLISSYETTAIALTFIVYELAAHPEMQSKLLAEIATTGAEISMSSLKKLSYMELFIKEALRKNPFVVGVIARRCMSDCTVGGITIPEGALVAVDLWSVHSDEDYWGPDTDKLIPERFLDSERADSQRVAWLTFGVGPRKCLGSKLAMLQIKMCLVQLLRKFHLRLSADMESPLPLYEAGLVEPRDGVRVHLFPKEEN